MGRSRTFFGSGTARVGGHELVTLLFTLLPRWAVSASFRPLETWSFENAAPVAACSPFFRLCCISARRAARNNEELGSLELDFGPGVADLQISGRNRKTDSGGLFRQLYLPEELVATIIQVAADVRRLPLHSDLGPYGTANLVPPGTSLEGLL